MFHKEGLKIISISSIILLAAVISIDAFIDINWLAMSMQSVFVILYILVLQFFRNPKRNTQLNSKHVLSPVDGKVVVIEEVQETEFFKDKRIQVSIFMSPLNVHVTRYPIGGEVKYSKYHPGKYLVAWHPKASTENERTTIVVESPSIGKILYRQIAGAVAKRIVNYAVEGDNVEQGTDSGFIKFGSRVDVFLPIGTTINVALNQKVKGGEQVIATL